MNSNDAFQKILKSYERYYDVSTENIEAPFAAEAVFNSHNEQYFLIKEAKLSDIDSNEFVFFYVDSDVTQGESSLSQEDINSISEKAWLRGLERVKPYYGHRNTDITFIYISEKITDETFRLFKKLKYYKSYKFGLYGWSAFRALAYETSTGRAVTNRRGSDLKKLAANL
ncbi:hypothetical protein [Treponema sp.]|uniref:hypothetical protein n=1 Tax=Treponema sp. TaxID=166 RepID=UPI00388EAB0A